MRILAASLLAAGLCAAQESDPLVSKSITHVFSVADRVFAFGDTGKAFSRLNLFADPPGIRNGTWPYPGGAEGGANWRESRILRGNSWRNDSTRVARVAALSYGLSWKADSLIFGVPRESAHALVRGPGVTALAVWRDTLVLGFGRLGLAFMTLAPENDPALFAGRDVSFSGLLSQGDSLRPLIACRFGNACRVDTVTLPQGGLDSVTALAVDSSAADSVWLLVATQAGLRRALLRASAFPRVSLPGISDTARVAVRSLAANPARRLLWAFTGARFFFSDDHGRSFRVPPSIPGAQTAPSALTGYSAPPQAAFFGDTTFVNFNLDRPGLVVFRRDSLQRNKGAGEISDVILDAEDGLDMVRGEGGLTELAVVRGGNEAVLAVGSTSKGIFHRRLSAGASAEFSNINRLRGVKAGLTEVITYPTLLTGALVDGAPEQVRLGYRLKKDGRVTITVFNSAMEKVRTLVKSAPRRGGIARSENPAEDRWDGRDAGGRFVSVGTYYILVESDQGERGFGKALVVRGRQ